jgi:hypothetical protein
MERSLGREWMNPLLMDGIAQHAGAHEQCHYAGQFA